MLLKKHIKTRYITLTRMRSKEGLWCQLCKYWDFNDNSDHRTCKQNLPSNAKLLTIYDHCINILYYKLKIFPKSISIGTTCAYVVKED